MSIADLMESMAKAGAPMEAILLAVRALEAKDAVIEARRAGDRERKRRQRGTVTGQSRDEDGTVTDPTPFPASPNENNLTPSTHTPVKRNTTREAWPCPEGVEPRHWADFLANRKRKKLTNSQTAHEGVLADLASLADAHWPPGRLVQHAAAKGWGSINYPTDGPQNGSRNGTHGMGRNRGAVTDHLDAAQLAMQDFGYHRH